jgi:hypothetical protein
MSSKAREALDKIGNISAFVAENCGNTDTAKYMNDIISIVQEAIAEPLRNCDVGTAEEQYTRFKKWCEGQFYKRPMNALTGEPCKSCPCYSVTANGVDGCNYLRWAQTPYESEVK